MGEVQAELWENPLLEDAMDRFWDRFFVERSEFRSFTLAQSDHFPNMFITSFIDRLNSARWTRRSDPGYEIARKIMGRLAPSFSTAPDPDEYISSIFDLDKRLKRKAEKERKKLSPSVDLSVIIEISVDRIWETFFLDRTTNLRSFAASQQSNFPPRFSQRLDRAGWSQSMDPNFSVPAKVMARLAASVAKPLEIDQGFFLLITTLEANMEAAQMRVEAERRAIEARLRREQGIEAYRARRAKKKAKKAALNKAAKEARRILKEKNQMNRVGAKSLGL